MLRLLFAVKSRQPWACKQEGWAWVCTALGGAEAAEEMKGWLGGLLDLCVPDRT